MKDTPTLQALPNKEAVEEDPEMLLCLCYDYHLATNISPFKGTFEDDHFPFLQVGYVSSWRVAGVWNGEQEFGVFKIYLNLFILVSQEAT